MARSSARPPAAPASPPPPIDALASPIAAAVRQRGGLPRRELPRLPPAARAALDGALRGLGLEVTRAGVRVPARAQLLALFDAGAVIEEKGLAARLVCVSATEAKAEVQALVRDEQLRRVERPTGPSLARDAERTVDAADAVRLADELERAMKWVKRAAKAPRRARASLLERDVADLLARLTKATAAAPPGRASATAATAAHAADAAQAAPAAAVSASGPSGALLDLLSRTAVELASQHGGLAPVPTLVRAVDAPTATVHAALLEGHARGRFELQPESSMGRLGADELALCLPGPEGTRLSWVRPLGAPRSSEIAR